MIKLTAYSTGEPIYISPTLIRNGIVRSLPAKVYIIGGDIPREHGKRTRIDTHNSSFLVRETAEEIIRILHVRDSRVFASN